MADFTKTVYLDHAATTPPSTAAIEAANQAMATVWGNPSSVHAAGLAAARLREKAREQILNALHVRFATQSQLIFTASGTEADNLAILGAANAKNFPFIPRLILSDSEHPAVMQPAMLLQKKGWEVIRLSTKGGIIDPAELENALCERTVLVSVMTANNETGAVYDIPNLFSLVHQKCPKALTHTDAVQAFGKIPVSPDALHADMITVSAHKIHGLKGAGALYVSREVLKRRALVPIVYGGGQENELRSGTEAMPCIAAFGAAAQEISQFSTESIYERTDKLRSYLLSQLDKRITVNQPCGSYLPGTLSISLPAIRSEIMLRFLSERGIYVSAGSACSSHKNTVNPVLLAFGLPAEQADCTLRISFSHEQSEQDLQYLATTLTEGIETLTKKREPRKHSHDN